MGDELCTLKNKKSYSDFDFHPHIFFLPSKKKNSEYNFSNYNPWRSFLLNLAFDWVNPCWVDSKSKGRTQSSETKLHCVFSFSCVIHSTAVFPELCKVIPSRFGVSSNSCCHHTLKINQELAKSSVSFFFIIEELQKLMQLSKISMKFMETWFCASQGLHLHIWYWYCITPQTVGASSNVSTSCQ